MALYVGKPTDLVAHGPVIAVKLWVPKQVVSTLAPIDTLAVIDTALATTCIQEGVATSLGLQPSGMVTITTATTVMYKTHLFRIRVAFPEGNMSFEVQAAQMPYRARHTAIRHTELRRADKHIFPEVLRIAIWMTRQQDVPTNRPSTGLIYSF